MENNEKTENASLKKIFHSQKKKVFNGITSKEEWLNDDYLIVN